ncbi:glycerol-3-phosphate 1-O-acyltransferase PlsY [Anaerofustis stercorihominis]|uniref:glycerol-3-phosphate 1-O-acyltransferase PlsY n=1 Tax=Anaerofustis stercorihominis TaxID=214853 RepID=UPI00214B5066|nr:glycerol-3-phosphate 1-O-acyltransferase PlsY [Anaerofustis stercorihominis]MCR2032724.1 glycerol-3-phosphate 1-O-acyltransferase PlsY [Anaerofustis stercorihominis]
MNIEFTFLSLVIIIASYFIGCINGAYIFSKSVKKEDIRTYGSGNAGATNALRTYGFFSGLLVFLIDFFKGMLAVGLCYIFNQSSFVILIASLFCVAGHNWPIFMGFRGGKGVSASAGILVMVDYRLALMAILIGLILALITRMVSVGSLTALTLSAVFFIVFKVDTYYIILSCILCILSIYQHRLNIKRIINGNENKLSFGKKDK